MYNYNRKNLIFIIISVLLLTNFLSFSPKKVSANFDLNVNTAILVDAKTGKVLFEKNADVELGIASMSKMMTEYLILEAIINNKLTWDQVVPISPWVAKLSHDAGGSNVFLEVDGTYTVKDLYEAVAIESANAATMALAEYLGGSYANFVKLMNDKAAELKIDKYNFVNSTGLPNKSYQGHHIEGTTENDENRMSARGTVQLAYHLINQYPQVLETSKIPLKYFQGDLVTDKDWKQCKEDWTCMKNWNDMLPGLKHYYEGLDGLKTGYTDLAKYTFTGTAERGESRLISVVMGADTIDLRFIETAKLLDYGFNNFEEVKINESMELPVVFGKEKVVTVSPKEDLLILAKTGESDLYSAHFELNPEVLDEEGNLIAPFEAGEVVGWLTYNYTGENKFTYLTEEGQMMERIPLVTAEAVEKASWFSLTMRAIGSFFSGIWTSVADTVKGIF